MFAESLIGQQVGRYTVLDLVGRGGMGIVFKAADPAGDVVALKVMVPELSRDQEFRRRFIRESQIELDHPNVIKIFDAGVDGGRLYLTMPLVSGYDLKDLIAREGRLLPSRVLAIFTQAAGALDAAHENGIVHRDVKPQNFLLDQATGRDHLYLTDFGLVKTVASQSSLTAGAHLLGTAYYMSPEQIRNQKIDGRSDIYSLGCVLYESLTGCVPFAGQEEVAVLFSHVNDPRPKVSEKIPVLPRALDDVVGKAMAMDPTERYLAAGELASDLQAVLKPESRSRPLRIQSAPPQLRSETGLPSTKEHEELSPSRSGWVVAALAVVVAVIALVTRTDTALQQARTSARSGGDRRSEATDPTRTLQGDSSPRSGAVEGRKQQRVRRADPPSKARSFDLGSLVPVLPEGSPGPASAAAASGSSDANDPPERLVRQPRSGTYVFEQSGHEAICPQDSGCTEGADLSETQEVRVTPVSATSTEAVNTMRISPRFAIASLLTYSPERVGFLESVLSFSTSHGAYRVRLRPRTPADLLLLPARPHRRWEGSWTSGPVLGRYSGKVLGRGRTRVGSDTIRTVQVKNVLRWGGEHPGILQTVSQVDPETLLAVETTGYVRSRTDEEGVSYEANFRTLLTRGPGYSDRARRQE